MGQHIDTLAPGFAWQAEALEWPLTTDVGPGLEGVVACTTRVVWLDPSSGILAYRGVPIDDLAFDCDFEQVAYLLITGARAEADPDAFHAFRSQLRAGRDLPADVVALLTDMDPATHPTRMLRAGVAALGCHELAAQDDQAGDRHWRELRIVGQVAGLVGVIASLRRGKDPTARTPTDTSLSTGVLTALLGRKPSPLEVRTLDLAWVMYAAHGLDAPTFTSMIVASCLADPYANVVAGLSALRGDLQGGAAEGVALALDDIAAPGDAEAWVIHNLAEGRRIPGFGHRSLAMPDPRVVVLRKACAVLARRAGRGELFEKVRTLEAASSRRLAAKGVHVNLNLYGAPVFRLLGAAPPEVPVLVAAARMAGMVALVREALDSIRLFRPLSRYVGPAERRLVPAGGHR